MQSLSIETTTRPESPIELIESVLLARDWPVESTADDELVSCAQGSWCEYNICWAWREEIEALHFSCAFDFRVPKERRPEVYAVLAHVNEQMLMGHFDLWSDEGMLMFRHALPLGGGAVATEGQCEDLLDLALDACERFFPAFQFVIWAGKTAEEAVQLAMLETAGEA